MLTCTGSALTVCSFQNHQVSWLPLCLVSDFNSCNCRTHPHNREPTGTLQEVKSMAVIVTIIMPDGYDSAAHLLAT